ncbi:MAG: 30S ribosome-binding factor RbfA [Candidatus Omnitrophota bacterium]
MPRYDRVGEALKREIGNIIQFELKDPRLGFITVTQVEVTPDLRYAKVLFSVLGKEEEHQKTKEALDSALGFIRRLIAQRIRLRFVPEISFKEDRSVEYSIRIQEALNGIEGLTETPLPSPKKAVRKKRKVARREPKKISRKPKKK